MLPLLLQAKAQASANRQQSPGLSTTEKIIFGGLGVVAVGGLIFLSYKLIQGYISGSEEKKASDDQSAAAYAKQIKMAFKNDGWPGVNEAALRQTIRTIPSRNMFDQVIGSYQKMYNDNLMVEFSDNLDLSEYNEMMQIIAGKPEKGTKVGAITLNYVAWARRMKAAFLKEYGIIPGTDESAIRAVFLEIPTQAAFIEMGKAYHREYGSNVLDDMKEELFDSEYKELLTMIIRKPK